MKKLLVYMDEDMHEDLKELAHRHKVSMSELVRYAVDKTFEEQLDVVAAERGWKEYLEDPSAAISLDDYLKERGIELPHRSDPKSPSRARQVAEGRARYSTPEAR